MTSPYSDLPHTAFWSTGVASRSPLEAAELYQPKKVFSRTARFATAGSCFAQHIGRSLKAAKLKVVDAESVPAFVDTNIAQKFGYGLYSARYGNIYTVRQMLQLLKEAEGIWTPEHLVWEKNGRFYDALRPGVEPNGLPTVEDVLVHRAQHLEAVREVFSNIDVFVFTLGLTEAWVSKGNGTVYPTCPGTIAGDFDPELYEFQNFRYHEIWADFLEIRDMLKAKNNKLRFVLTVSPVPLTATASGKHVEVATCHSKAVLRAVAGALADRLPYVDYFPSYEVITSQAARGAYFEPNLRQVSKAGVETAMNLFMRAHDFQNNNRRNLALREKKAHRRAVDKEGKTEAEICEDTLLEAFVK